MKRLRDHGVHPGSMIASFLLLALAALVYFMWNGQSVSGENRDDSRSGNIAPSGILAELDYTGLARNFSDGAGIFLCTNDGVKRYSNDLKTLWDYPLSFTNPVFIENNGYVGVSEYKARTYYAFGGTGLIYSLELDNEILNFSVSKEGYSSVIVSTDTGYTINIYNKTGKLLRQFIFQDKLNYPVASDISEDGRILAVSFLDTSQMEMRSSISTYFIDEEEVIDYQNGLFANFSLIDGQIISKLHFMEGNRLLFVSDRRIGMYEETASNQMAPVWQRDINNEILHLGYLSAKAIVLALGKPIANSAGEDEGTLLILGIDGTNLAAVNETGVISYLSCGRGTAIIGVGAGGRKFSAVNDRGKLLWEYTSTADVSDIVTLDDDYRVLVSTASKLEVLEKAGNRLSLNNSENSKNTKEESADITDEAVTDENIALEPVSDKELSDTAAEPDSDGTSSAPAD